MNDNHHDASNLAISELTGQYRSGTLSRRAFLRRLGALGVASTVAYQLVDGSRAIARATDTDGEEDPTTQAEGEEADPTTLAVGEEEDPTTEAEGEEADPTTLATGEEDDATTEAEGEEADPTTLATGEEDEPTVEPTTLATGEEDEPTVEPTTLATGEEDEPVEPTTLAAGEEDPNLAFTGSESTIGLAGLGMVAAGAAALGARRRIQSAQRLESTDAVDAPADGDGPDI